MALIYALSSILAFLLTFYFNGLIRKFAYQRKIFAPLRQRDIHLGATPRLGGAAIVLGLVITLVVIYLLNPNFLNFTNQFRAGIDRHFLGILIGVVLLMIVGIYDDLRDLSPGKQLFWQFIAAGIIVASGIGINFIRSPWGILPLDQWTWHLFTLSGYSYTITLWSDLFTVVWLILMMNVINWLDGLDGLAAGISIIAGIMLFVLTFMIHDVTAVAILAIVFVGSVGGFLPWNWHPAKMFMGSAGSNTIGYILGILAIVSGGKLAISLLVLGLPVFDAILVAVSRIIKGKSPFKADRSHLHHRLLKAGFTVQKTVILLYLITFIFGILGLIDANAQAKLVLLVWAAAVLVLIVAITLILEKINGKKIQ